MDNDNEFYIPQDIKSSNSSSGNVFHLSKADNDLYKDDLNTINQVYQVKRKETKKNGESWFILCDKEIILEIKAYRLNNAEKSFFRSVDGIKFLLGCAKNNCLSLTKIKENMKKYIKEDEK